MCNLHNKRRQPRLERLEDRLLLSTNVVLNGPILSIEGTIANDVVDAWYGEYNTEPQAATRDSSLVDWKFEPNIPSEKEGVGRDARVDGCAFPDGVGPQPGKPGGGMAGSPGMPGGIEGPESGDDAPLFGQGNGRLPGFDDPTGMGNLADKIVTPDQMDEHAPIGSIGNLYGGINPNRDPRGGGNRGEEQKGSTTMVYEGNDVENAAYVYDAAAGSKEKSAHAVTVRQDSDGTVGLEYYHPDGSVTYVTVFKDGSSMRSNINHVDGWGDRSSKSPLSTGERRLVQSALLDQAYAEMESGPAVQNDGGVVDPVRNQANVSSEAEGSGEAVERGQAVGQTPMIAESPGSQVPSAKLTGGGRVDNDEGDTQIRVPQGFQVIDPPEASP